MCGNRENSVASKQSVQANHYFRYFPCLEKTKSVILHCKRLFQIQVSLKVNVHVERFSSAIKKNILHGDEHEDESQKNIDGHVNFMLCCYPMLYALSEINVW